LGLDEQARRVLLHKQRQRRRQRPLWARWWGWLQDALAGYGYAPGRALLLLAGAFVAGWVVFSTHHPAPAGPGPHPAFNAALYTVDVLIPAPAIAQAGDWYPRSPALSAGHRSLAEGAALDGAQRLKRARVRRFNELGQQRNAPGSDPPPTAQPVN
jgi:hypothetical protein